MLNISLLQNPASFLKSPTSLVGGIAMLARIGFGLRVAATSVALTMMSGAVLAQDTGDPVITPIPAQSPEPATCMGVKVTFADGRSIALIGFRVSGTPEQLDSISSAANEIGAKVTPRKVVDGRLMMIVFFESSVNWFKAMRLTNDISSGKYHPGLDTSLIDLEAQFEPVETLQNCQK